LQTVPLFSVEFCLCGKIFQILPNFELLAILSSESAALAGQSRGLNAEWQGV
jgi:hypothetical protein